MLSRKGFCCHERVFAVMKGLRRGCNRVVTRAVTRVEQKVVEAANVSLLALYKEGKSNHDPPPWTPAIHHPSSATNLESHTCDGTKPATIVRCRLAEHPLSLTARYPSEP